MAAIVLVLATRGLAQVPTWDVRMDPALYDTLYQRDPFSDVYLPTISVSRGGVTRTDAQIRFKGHSTRYYPKKPFRLKFASDFESIRQINLNPMYTDRSFIRERLAWDLYADMGALAPTASHVMLRINGRYQGLYLQVDKVDKYFLRNRGRTNTSPMYDASDLYAAADLTVQPDSLMKLFYEKEIGNENDYSDLAALIAALNSGDEASFPATVDALFDSRTILQWFAGNILTMSGDSYSKNYYLLHDTTRTPRRWTVIPWDYDVSFGRDGDFGIPYPAMLLNDGFAYTFEPLAGPSNVLKDRWLASPILMERLRGYLDTLLTTCWTEERFHRRIDSLATLVAPMVREEPGPWGTYQDFLDHVETLKYFVTARRNYLLSTFVHPPRGEYDLVTLAPAMLNVPYHAVAFDGRQIATLTFSSMTGLDSILVRVYPDGVPPGLVGSPSQGHVRRWLELTPYPPTAKFTASVRWEYSDFSLATREVAPTVQDERMLRASLFDGAGYTGMNSRINPHGNFVTIEGVTEAAASPGRHIALLVPGSYAQQWTRMPLLTNWHRFYAIDRQPPAHIGMAGDQGLFFHSTDGGANWTEQFTGQSTPLYGLSACNDWAGNDWLACGAAGSLYRSPDGTNWTRIPLTTRKDLLTVVTGEAGNRYLAGDGLLYHSTDGGSTWSARAVDTTIVYRAVAAPGPARLLAAGDRGRVLLSTDAGITWSNTHTAGGMTLRALRSFAGRYCWVAGDSGTVLFSSDSGATWVRKVFPRSISLRAVWPEDSLRVYVAGEGGVLYYSTDRGDSWYSQYSADTHDLQALHFSGPANGFAAGSSGTILTTSSPGTTTSAPAFAAAVPNRFTLSQNYPNPFNPVTTIAFTIPGSGLSGGKAASGETGPFEVDLTVYDMLGRHVATIIRANLSPGAYSVRFDAGNLASGMYLYRLTASGLAITKKMMVLK